LLLKKLAVKRKAQDVQAGSERAKAVGVRKRILNGDRRREKGARQLVERLAAWPVVRIVAGVTRGKRAKRLEKCAKGGTRSGGKNLAKWGAAKEVRKKKRQKGGANSPRKQEKIVDPSEGEDDPKTKNKKKKGCLVGQVGAHFTLNHQGANRRVAKEVPRLGRCPKKTKDRGEQKAARPCSVKGTGQEGEGGKEHSAPRRKKRSGVSPVTAKARGGKGRGLTKNQKNHVQGGKGGLRKKGWVSVGRMPGHCTGTQDVGGKTQPIKNGATRMHRRENASGFFAGNKRHERGKNAFLKNR